MLYASLLPEVYMRSQSLGWGSWQKKEKKMQGIFGKQVGESLLAVPRSQEKMVDLKFNQNMKLNMLTKGRYY